MLQRESTVDGALAMTKALVAPAVTMPAQGSFRATSDFAVLADCDAVSVCVPTPLNKTGDPDISYIASATEQIPALFASRHGHCVWIDDLSRHDHGSAAASPAGSAAWPTSR